MNMDNRGFKPGKEVQEQVATLTMKDVNALMDRINERETRIGADEAIGIYFVI
jgi:hypothetical protein